MLRATALAIGYPGRAVGSGAAGPERRRQDDAAEDAARPAAGAGRRGRTRRPAARRLARQRTRTPPGLRAAGRWCQLRVHGRRPGADGPQRARRPAGAPVVTRPNRGRRGDRTAGAGGAGRTADHDAVGRQLALVARALAQEAHIIVLDEPTASLDFGNQGRVMREMRRLAADGLGVLFSSHDPNHALRFADKALLVRDGCLLASGPVADVVVAPQLAALYGVAVEELRDNDGRSAFLPA